MNTIEIVALLVAIVIIVVMLCATKYALTIHKSNPERFNTAANLCVEKMEKIMDKYNVVVDVFPDGKIEYFVGSPKEGARRSKNEP